MKIAWRCITGSKNRLLKFRTQTRYNAIAIKQASQSTGLYVIAQAFDILTTYLITPDLNREANILVEKYGFGWTQMLLLALLSSLAMLFAQTWIWCRLFQHFPQHRAGYKSFYQYIFHVQGKPPGSVNIAVQLAPLLFGIVFIAAYAAIASKLLVSLWNLTVLIGDLAIYPLSTVVIAKAVLSVGFGLFMFFIYPYHLHLRHTENPPR